MQVTVKRKTFSLAVPSDADTVIFGIPIPGQSTMTGAWGEVHVMNNGLLDVSNVAMYRCDGWLLPVVKPDTSITYDVLHDYMVPKDQDYAQAVAGTVLVDYDSDTANTAEYGAYGDMNLEELFQVGIRPEHVFARQVLMSAVSHARNTIEVTAPSYEWFGGDVFKIRLKKKLYCPEPSILLFAISKIEGEEGVQHSTPVQQNWAKMKYAGDYLSQALLAVLGNVEAGAESPYEDLFSLLEYWLEPEAVGAAGAEAAVSMYVSGKFTAQIRIPGSMDMKSITPGG